MKLFIIPAVAAGIIIYLTGSTLAAIQTSRQCDDSVAEWLTYATWQGLHDPANEMFYATQLAKVSISCPNGNKLVDETRIPVSITQLASRPEIVQVALQKIEEKKKKKP